MDVLPSGYVTDKELFKWALIGLNAAIADQEQVIAKNEKGEHLWAYTEEEITGKRNLIQHWKEQTVYLKEVLDGLG